MKESKENSLKDNAIQPKDYGGFYKYMKNVKSPEKPKYKKSGQIVKDSLMKDRKGFETIDKLKQQDINKLYGNVSLSQEKTYMIDKMIRRKLLEKSADINYSELIAPIINDKGEDLQNEGSNSEDKSFPVETEKKEESKVPEISNNDSKDINQKLASRINAISSSEKSKENKKGISYEEWMKKKEAEEKLRKHMIELEKQEMQRYEEQKLREKEELEAKK